MKHRAWRVTVLFVVLFSSIYYGVLVRGDRGDLQNPDIIRMVYQPLSGFNGWFTDLKLRFRGNQPIKNKIVIAAIDLDSIGRFGRWPWRRDFTAKILEEIDRYHPRIIASDLLVTEAEKTMPDELKKALIDQHLENLERRFESDPVLAATITHLSDRLVMGSINQVLCQPTQTSEAAGSTCLINDHVYEKAIQNGFSRFSLQHYTKNPAFDFSASPLIIAHNPVLNLSDFQKAAKHIGFFDENPDSDGINRNSVLVEFANELPMPSFSLEIARVALGEELSISLGSEGIKNLWFTKSNRAIDITPIGRMGINYRGSPSLFPHISIVDLMNDSPQIPMVIDSPKDLSFNCKSCKYVGRIRNRAIDGVMIDKDELFKDAVVLIGTTNIGNDLRPMPNYATAAGVEGHAMIVDNLMSGDYLRASTNANNVLIVILLLTVGALLFAASIEYLPSVPAILFFVGGFLVLMLIDVKFLFVRGINLHSGFIYAEYFLIASMILINKYIAEEQQKRFIKLAFSRFVSPQVVQAILEDPKQLALNGTRRELTVMFSDIRSFMPFSARLEPKDLHEFLNLYHDTMTKIVIEKGTLDKYIGDAIMAFWGAPLPIEKHAFYACQAAIRMIHELKKQNVVFKEKYNETISIGIGINTGPVIVGNMGSKEIFSYTIIGDDVNLASRVERLTRVYGVYIVATRATLDAIQASGEALPDHRVLDRLQVLGADHPIDAIQILDQPLPADALVSYAAGLKAYFARNWDLAIENFKACQQSIQSHLGFSDYPCERMIGRCEQFKVEPPPADWDGVWQMTRK